MEATTQARYGPGDAVKVRSDTPQRHHRTPWYIKGKTGRVVVLCGVFPNPESRAYGGDGLPRQPLYRVEFDQTSIWEDGYKGPSADTILVDVYEEWLEPACRILRRNQ